MKGKEFVKKILEGERDFSRIKLEEYFICEDDLQRELNIYLKLQKFENNPVILNESELIGLNAILYMPNLQAKKTNFLRSELTCSYFEGADFSEAIFLRASLENTDFESANLENANLIESNLEKSNFYHANLRYANLFSASIIKANFGEADLTGANLKKAVVDVTNFNGAILKNAKLAEIRGYLITEWLRGAIFE
ncbi:MAG: pentapeptide repeat-containing protein [Candidatus Aenigmatarchaeota archaeon]